MTYNSSIDSHIKKTKALLKNFDLDAARKILKEIIDARDRKSKIFIFGNGGSAATALHMCTDFAKTKEITRIPIKVLCLNSNISYITAIGNDNGYEFIFSDQIEELAEEQDIVIGISASGNSLNCVNAFKSAKKCKAITIGILGFDGGKMKELSDFFYHVNINDYFSVEDVHMILSHSITHAIRNIN
jgi:D-sedoheptulose 7-phosphate isomerase